MTYFNGNLHIVSYPHCVLRIHLETMQCQQVELPEPAKNGAHLGNSVGCLCYFSGNDNNKLSVWMLESGSNTYKWVLKHNISLKSLTVGSIRFLAFHPELEMIYLLVNGKLVSYDMSNKRIEEVGDFGGEKERCYLVQIWLFQFSNCVSDCLLKEKL
ncbi:uncharacterized protein LOC109829400 [Asparagus officinalis]|uniref:uncharacterized protein LOC109829400 n=1 Tax=Asparagus officinalis TaxID=4686 RepID=UPI00098E18A1|nr:uncharacterized protein LOC109829400 [Asparagus officinalis]